MMALEDILIQFGIVICASLIGSFIFSIVFLKVIKLSIVSSATKLISPEAKKRAAEWFQEVIKNGISESLKDAKVKKIVEEILELIKEKFIKDDEEEKIGGGKEKK